MTPKQNGFYMPGEWFPHSRCWMAWPCHEATWSDIGLDKARKAYHLVAETIAKFEPVTLLVHPRDLSSAQSLCSASIQLCSMEIDDSWTRDTGPSFLIDIHKKLAAVDWIHNAWGNNYNNYEQDGQIATKIAYNTQAKLYHAPLVMEGGAIHVDGEGTVLTTKECLLNPNRNPQLTPSEIENLLKEFLNCEKIIWLNEGLVEDETNGHVDEIACFIAPGKVLCLITEDKQDPNYFRLQENLQVLKDSVDAKGRHLEVYSVLQPPETQLNGKRLSLSYINFYHANKGIVMPAFGYEVFDKAACQLISALFPSYKIMQVPAMDIFAGGGGIHCITQQQPRV